MSTPRGAEKSMSSRLLTMKFMQRAGASPRTPSASPGGLPSKRIRLSNGTASPATPSLALQDALDAEEAQRLQALEKHAEAMGETRWVLSVQQKPVSAASTLNVVTASFGDIDALSDDDTQSANTNHNASLAPSETDEAPAVGRRIFGKVKNRPIDGQTNEDDSDSSASSSDSEVDDPDDPAARLIREERKEAAAQARDRRRAKRKSDQAELDRLASERRRKVVKLNKLTSISGGGGSRSGPSTPSKDITCYKCGKQGHTRAQCPNA